MEKVKISTRVCKQLFSTLTDDFEGFKSLVWERTAGVVSEIAMN